MWRGRRYIFFGPVEWLLACPAQGFDVWVRLLVDEQAAEVIQARHGRVTVGLWPGWFLARHVLNPLEWVRALVRWFTLRAGEGADASGYRWHRRPDRRGS